MATIWLLYSSASGSPGLCLAHKKWKVKSVVFLMSTQRIARLGGATQRGGQAERRMVASGGAWGMGGAVDRIDVRRKCS